MRAIFPHVVLLSGCFDFDYQTLAIGYGCWLFCWLLCFVFLVLAISQGNHLY